MAITISFEKYDADGNLSAARPASNANALISIDGAALTSTLGTWNNLQGDGFAEYTLHASEEAALTDRALLFLPGVTDTWRPSWARYRANETEVDITAIVNAIKAIEVDGVPLIEILEDWDPIIHNRATGLKGPTVSYYKRDGITIKFTAPVSPAAGTRGELTTET